MRPDRFRWITTAFALAALVITLPACSDDDDPTDPGDGPAYVGSWNATGFTALGTDFIDDGMALSATFTETTYAFTVTNDLVGVCGGEEVGQDCSSNGPIAVTGSQFTIDAGDVEDEVTFNYSISGSTMTWTGSIDGIPATVVWARVN